MMAVNTLVVAAEVAPAVPLHVFPRIIVPDAREPIRLQSVDVKAEVLGQMAHTRIEMVFYNPNERVLQGELQFPLLDGQTVTGFALDINGELRSAVPVEKAKGQQVFEDVARVRIDPALLEKTQGNNYKLRVYPLPAQSTRRVVLEFDEVLPRHHSAGTDHSTYRLPLQFAENVEQLNVNVHSAAAEGVNARLGAERIKVDYTRSSEHGAASQIVLSRKNFAGRGMLQIDYPDVAKTLVATETHADQTYFYAEVAAPVSKSALRVPPKKLGLIWDASGSGASRDHLREFALLDAYFKALDHVEVQLVVARDRAESPQSFTIVHGDWHALRRVLENVAYDGATNAEALLPSAASDLNVLFTDGIINYGAGKLASGNAPLYTVSASAGANLLSLRLLAESSGGRLLDLLNKSSQEAVGALTHQNLRLAGMLGANELVSESVYPESGKIKIAGVLTEPQATIELDWIDPQGRHQLQQIKVQNSDKTVASLAANRWAALRLAELETDYRINRTAILRLGSRFGMVTRETSLIVLDRVEDYVRYEITPPESLRLDYQRKLAEKGRLFSEQRSAHLDEVAGKFAKKISWWEMRFPKGELPPPPKVTVPVPVSSHVAEESSMAMPEPRAAAAPVRATVAAAFQPLALISQGDRRATSQPKSSRPGGNIQVAPVMDASIRLKQWQPDAVYAKRLREVEADQMYRVYLDERADYLNSTAFYLDVADIFFERGQAELGLRILSNLAEMNLENRQILRILAYRLIQARQIKLALPILQQVKVLSPNEPQSWRDLGLAYAGDGQYQLAVEQLWEVVAKSWDGRFPDIELIALDELNAIIARAPQGTVVDTTRMDQRLLRNLPEGVRAVLSWDADNTDIDLWVTDPNGEKVYFAHNLSYQGGAISRDFTGGYGPEVFTLRDAKPGKYKVQVQFYGNRQQVIAGATTLMLHLSTAFGTPEQKDENIILRLVTRGDMLEVGEFEVKER
jgi:tetratricopeptide (TPR) repeat protein